MKYQRAKRDALRALTSEVLPYEVPLPFTTAQFYGFLRKLQFRWEGDRDFSVSASRISRAEKAWLEVIFERYSPKEQDVQVDGRLLFKLQKSSRNEIYQPYRYRARRNNGKNRNLALPHPYSMLKMARFIHEYSDSILYFANRSNFSIRHPQRVARVSVKPPFLYAKETTPENKGFEQYDLDYRYVSSYFAYKRFSNINRFYSSAEFRACERKYPKLIHADISKCFDSIYTHTISWVTNGADISKYKPGKTEQTFGGRFDRLMQNLNSAETNGIIIGPELSRVFAEIIIQEVDIRVERQLRSRGLRNGTDYEIMRYVDDYFVFVTNPTHVETILETLAGCLSEFKLHLNDHKEVQFDTPLDSHMSVAKLRLREALKQRTICEVDLESEVPTGRLYLSSHHAILDYKGILIDSELHHEELANSYLYELTQNFDESLRCYGGYIDVANESEDPASVISAKTALLQYCVSVFDVALSVYSGAPSVSHSLKLSNLVVSALFTMNAYNVRLLEQQSFKDKAQRELAAQISSHVADKRLGIHTLVLLDCMIFIDPEIQETDVYDLIGESDEIVNTLDAFGVLTLLRACTAEPHNPGLRSSLLSRAKHLISVGETDRRHETERAILRMSLPIMPGASLDELSDATGLSKNKLRLMRKVRVAPSLFAWNANDHYQNRLRLKSMQLVY